MRKFLWKLMFVLFPQILIDLGPYIDSPEVEFKRFLEKLRNKTDEYNSFMDGIYSSLESSLHSLNIEGYLKL